MLSYTIPVLICGVNKVFSHILYWLKLTNNIQNISLLVYSM